MPRIVAAAAPRARHFANADACADESRVAVCANADLTCEVATRLARKCRARLAIRRSHCRASRMCFCGDCLVGHAAGPRRAATSLAFCRMLPQSRDYDELYRAVPLADSGAIQYRRRCLRPLGRARSGQARHRRTCGADGRAHDVSYGWLRETSNRLANALRAHGIGRGDRVAILLPQTPEVAADPYRDLQARRHRAAARHAVRHRGARLPAAEFRRQGADHQRAGARQARARSRGEAAGPAT